MNNRAFCDPKRTRTPILRTGILSSIQLNYGTGKKLNEIQFRLELCHTFYVVFCGAGGLISLIPFLGIPIKKLTVLVCIIRSKIISNKLESFSHFDPHTSCGFLWSWRDSNPRPNK